METTHAHISQLIERFMEGQSTLAEEQELTQYFTTHEVSDEWKPLQAMFAYFDAGMPIEQPASSVKVPIAKRRLWWHAAAAAAVLLVCATIAFFIPHRQPETRKAPQYASNTPDSNPSQSTDTTRLAPSHVEPVNVLVAEHKASKQLGKEQTAKSKTRAHNDAAQRKQDSIEITRKQGEMELAQQELLAERIIMEQEREQMRREQMETRARLVSTREAMNYYNNNQPQATMVVFK